MQPGFDSRPQYRQDGEEHEEFCRGRRLDRHTIEAHDAYRDKLKNDKLPDTELHAQAK